MVEVMAVLADEIRLAQANFDKAPNDRACQMYLNGLLMAEAILRGEVE